MKKTTTLQTRSEAKAAKERAAFVKRFEQLIDYVQALNVKGVVSDKEAKLAFKRIVKQCSLRGMAIERVDFRQYKIVPAP